MANDYSPKPLSEEFFAKFIGNGIKAQRSVDDALKEQQEKMSKVLKEQKKSA